MGSSPREVVEGKQYQGEDERIVYTLTTTAWGSSPTSPVVVAKDITTGLSGATVVTSTVFPTNSPSVSGDVITLSPLRALTMFHLYRIEVQFTIGSEVFERFFEVECDG